MMYTRSLSNMERLSKDAPVSRKCGPREIGRMKGWKAADYGIDLKVKKGAGTDFLQERVTKVKKGGGESSDTSDFIYKPGPRDIGRNKGWKAADYGIKLKNTASNSDFLKERTATTKLQRSQSVYKPGPRDIGRNKGWKAADYGIDLTAKDPNFLKERVVTKKKRLIASKSEKIYKPGPRDIGRNKGWKPAKYGIDLTPKDDFLKQKTDSLTRTRTEPTLKLKRKPSKAAKRYSSFSTFHKPVLTKKTSTKHKQVIDELKENNSNLMKENNELKAQITHIKESSKATEAKLRSEIESLQQKLQMFQNNTTVEKVGSLTYVCTE